MKRLSLVRSHCQRAGDLKERRNLYMNNLISKIVGVCLGLSLATGVAVGVGAGNQEVREANAATSDLTFDLSSNPGGWPTANSATETAYAYTLSGNTYEFTTKNVKCNSGYLMMTSTAALGLPKISGSKLTKVVAYNSKGCSTSTKVGISSSSSSADYISGGAIKTWSTTGSSYTYNLSGTTANTRYYLYVTNKNAQVTQITLTYETTGGGEQTTYTGVTISEKTPLTGTYKGDAYYECTATVTGTGSFLSTVTWSITSSNTFGNGTSITNKASIDTTGKVTFLDNCTVYVWATAADNSTHNSTGFSITASGLVTNPITTWTKVTSASNVSTNKIYALSNDGAKFASSAINNKGFPLTDSYSSVGYFALISATGGYHLRLATYDSANSIWQANGYFVNNSSSSDLANGESGSSVWTTATQSASVYLTNSSNNGRHLGVNEAGTAVKAYSSDNIETYLPVYLYEVGSLPNTFCVSISLVDAPTTAMSTGDKVQLSYSALDNYSHAWNGTVEYSSSNTDVATISSTGLLEAVGSGSSNIAVTAKSAGQNGVDVTSQAVTIIVSDSTQTSDLIRVSDTDATSSSYVNTTGIQKHTAIYSSNNAKADSDHGSGLQYRSSNSNSGIVSTTSGGLIKSITIDFFTDARMDIYAKNTAYSAPSDLYSDSTAGTLVGSLSSDGTYTFNADYEYVGIRSYSGARYLTSIEFVWGINDATAPKIVIDQTGSEMAVGNSGTYTATKTNADEQNIVWSSSDSSIVEINASTGAYLAKKIGTSTITATLGDTGKTSSIIVTVTGTVSVAEAKNLADALPAGATSTYQVTLYGTVSEVINNNGFKQLILTDGTNTFTVHYGYATADNWATCAIVDNVVQVKGTLLLYNGETYELTNPHDLALRNSDNVAVDNFISTYMHMADYDPDLDNSEGTNACLGQSGYYITAKNALTSLTAAQIALFQSDDGYNSAQARYEAWAFAYGDSTPYGVQVSNAKFGFNFNVDNNAAIFALVAISMVTMTVVGAYFFLRKKKEVK